MPHGLLYLPNHFNYTMSSANGKRKLTPLVKRISPGTNILRHKDVIACDNLIFVSSYKGRSFYFQLVTRDSRDGFARNIAPGNLSKCE